MIIDRLRKLAVAAGGIYSRGHTDRPPAANTADEAADEIERLRLLLSNCAYWAANGLHGPWEQSHRKTLTEIMLENILKESKGCAISEPDLDNNIRYEGFEYTYVPADSWKAWKEAVDA